MRKITVSTHQIVGKQHLRDLKNLRKRYTVKSRYEDGSVVHMYRESKSFFGFPLYTPNPPEEVAGFRVVDKRTTGSAIPLKATATLRKEQVSLLREFHTAYNDGKTGFIFDARTGIGKTVMCIVAIAKLKRTTLIVVQKTDLLNQWRDRLVEHSNLTYDDIGVVHRDTCEWQGKPVVIAMLQTLLKRTYSKEFYRYFGTLCVDEVHTVAAPKFSQVCDMFPAYYRLGASATITRRDGMTNVFLHAMGEVVIRSDVRHEESLHAKVRVVDYRQTGPAFEMPKWARTTIARRSYLLTHLGEDPARCQLLAYYADMLAKKGRQVGLIAERTSQLRNIATFLFNKYKVPMSMVGEYTGATNKTERERVLNECNIILATTKMLSLGTDVPSLSCLILASPLASVVQPVGRILRKRSGKRSVIIVDVVDVRYPMTLKWFRNREKEYHSIKAEILVKEADNG